MTQINYQALREAAEKATQGNWWIDSHGQAMVSFIDNDVLEVFATDNKRSAVRHEDTGNLSRWRNDNDATFIATADPATVLALLDELEAAEKLIDTLRQDKDKVIDMSIERINKLLSRAESAEKRIAELEAREISLPERSSMLHRADFHDDYQTVMAYKVSEVIAAIRDSGIRIKGE
ncbi:TPA: ead/Ea22-like family protein [Escherichia coli]|nr:ead/Ea22-like family protein [Escherichia coli]HBA5573719.1 ead/Ea22-like family protein [Escherichia coli]